MGWFTGLPLIAKIIGPLVLVAIVLGIATALIRSHKQQQDEQNANLVNQGVLVERSATDKETINAIQESQNAVRNPSSNELNSVCGEYDRNCPHRP